MTWPHRPLADLLDLSIGGVWGKAPGDDEVDVLVARVTELRQGGRLDLSTAAHRSITERQLATRQLQPGDLLLEKSGGGPKTPVGRVGLVTGTIVPTVCANFMQLLRPNTQLVEPRFLHLYLHFFHLAGRTEAMQTASTNIRNIKASEYVQLDVPVPTLVEQRRIVETLEDHLSRLDAAADYASAAHRRINSLRRSQLDRLFGGAGARVPLGHLVSRIEAGKSLGGSAAPAPEDEWGIIKVSAMTWGRFRPDENKAIPAGQANPKYEIHKGDLLVSRANTADYVGASVLVGDDVRPRLLLSDKSLRLIPTADVDAVWLWRTLQSPSAREQISRLATGTKDSMRNISQKSLLRVQLPEASPEARRLAVIEYNAFEETATQLESETGRLVRRQDSLRRAILAAAFSGKLTGRHTDAQVIEEIAG